MSFYYRVWHPKNPLGAIMMAFKMELTKREIRESACRQGFFQWQDREKLEVLQLFNVETTLMDFMEVEVR